MEDFGNVYRTIIILVGVLGTVLTLKKYLTDIANEFKKPFDELRTEMKAEIALIDQKLESVKTDVERIKVADKEEQLGIQAGLRFALLRAYDAAKEKGYASLSDRDSFQTMWTQYEKLGPNGVMDDVHDDFFALPKEKPAPKRTRKKTETE